MQEIPVSDFPHAVIWIDHSEATVARFRGPEESDVEIRSHTSLQRLHHRQSGWEAGGNSLVDTEFYQRVVGAIEPHSDLVITGPGNAGLELKNFIDLHRPQLSARVVEIDGNEGIDLPLDVELRALWRRYFTGIGATQQSRGIGPGRATNP
jgi:hypothetical protein